MTLTIEFTTREETWIAAQTAQQGVPPAEIVKRLVDERISPALESEETDPTLELFAQWSQEDAAKTPEEIAAEDQLWQEFEQGINATRQAQGMRQL
ncbi:MAG: hypothetical protein JWN14_976 [Chthonomonadales bacterium]|nr:hypothetical protein [Chthonomonadales bacterium]